MVELPAGTVTFVFTDIEGSTKLLDELGGERYAEALAEHRSVVRGALASGHEVDTQGDAFFYAFERASDAVAGCEEAVAALEGGPIRVRIGMHTGEPVLTDEGYVGVDVHRAARIAGVAHGGQIVASRATRDLVPESEFVDLGEHRLKDLTRPEHLYQLGAGDFPPLRSLNLVNLPLQPTPLIGRTEEVAAIVGLLRDGARLVTLTGAGGSGKTRLALQAAAELADEFPDGVWFVPLQALDRPELVPLAVSSALGIDGVPTEWLRTRQALLVVDNVEHLLPDAAGVVRDLLTAEHVRVLATSRARLALAAEHELAVDPMEIAEGAALFVTRARQLHVGIERSPTIDEIVRAVDALPLAIELAAARTRIMPVEEIADRLSAPLELLRGGSLDSPPRHKTLRATIEWSVELLDAEERQTFTSLGVFRGSFDVEAAERVASADLDALSALVDKSLLRRTAEGRLFMLDTLQQYARELFAGMPDREEIERRHALLMSQRAEAGAEEAKDWRLRIEAEYADMRVMLAWLDERDMSAEFVATTLHLGRFWDQRDLVERRYWLERALEHVSDVSSADACEIRRLLAHIAWRQGDWPAAETWADQAIAGAEALGKLDTAAYAYSIRGAIAWFANSDTARATEEYERALSLARRNENATYTATFTHDLALLAFEEDRLADAEKLAHESLELARTAHHLLLEANALTTAAHVRLAEGDQDTFRTLAHRALTMQRDGDAPDVSLTESLVRLSYVAANEDAELACLLVGARDAWVAQSGAAIEPFSVRQRDEVVEMTQRNLGPTKTAEALAEGGRMSVSEAVDLALESVSPGQGA